MKIIDAYWKILEKIGIAWYLLIRNDIYENTRACG